MVVSEDGGIEGEGGNGMKSTDRSPLSTPAREHISNDPKEKQNSSLFRRSSTFRAFSSPKRTFWQFADEKDQFSRSVSSSSSHHRIRERLRGVFSRKIDWESLQHVCVEWFKNPMNLALFVWIVCVAVSGAILFLVMTGMLNKALPRKSQRDAWFEVNNQILNALFTLMCLYQHPKRFYDLVLLLRWKPEDISKLRKMYCRNGTYKPHEWAHMMIVVILLHINCFAQYSLCGLNVGYNRSQRPAIGVAICVSVAIASPAIAGVYMIVSPLGKEYEIQGDEESPDAPITIVEDKQREELRMKTFEKRFSFISKDDCNRVETSPTWKGGILDFWEDISLAYLSLFCSCCVFGWNMERIGFGNMYVHIATFLLFCSAPYWIFNLAALNINDEAVRQGLGISGVLLCVFGLLYGGYWRIRMRTRFNLPEYTFCCGKPAFSDCTLWLFCCWCSLAQEVRTANSYDVVDDKFCLKENDETFELGITQSAFDGPTENRSGPSSPFADATGITETGLSSPIFATPEINSVSHPRSVEDSSKSGTENNYMIPPSPLFINKESSK